MYKISFLLIFVIISVAPLKAHDFDRKADSASASDSDSEKNIYFTIRFGQGGFTDDRSPINKLGGGQLAIDIKHGKLPIGISISNEYYTNSSNPTNPYEISTLTAVNCLYYKNLLKSNRLNVFAGGGIGGMKVPQGNDTSANSMLFNFEAGINTRLLWKFGLYATYKYLYANKEDQVNFSEHIVLIGITFNFGF